MPDKGDIQVSIFAGDGQLWRGGPVTVKLVDPFAQDRKILVNKRSKSGVNTVVLEGAQADSGQNYAVLATAGGHRDAGIYPVTPKPGEQVAAKIMLVRQNPDLNLSRFSFDALRADSPRFHQALLAAGITEQEFTSLPPERIAGSLNIEAKLRSTTLAGTRTDTLLARIGSPDPEIAGTGALRQDRVFAFANPAMPDLVRQEMQQSDPQSFRELLPFENEVFHKGYPLSFKQRVPFGSLQLSFAAQPGDNNLLAADIDIDLMTDVGHFGEVIQNTLLKQKTDPFTVYRLLFDQGIIPLYTLKTSEAAAAPAAD